MVKQFYFKQFILACHLFAVGINVKQLIGSARGVMVIVAGIGHGDTSSNPGRN